MNKLVIAALALALSGVGTPSAAAQRGRDLGAPEVVSLLGRPLYRTPAEGEEALAKLESGLEDAGRKLEGDPANVEAIILYGRALAGLWRYHEAIDAYTRGLAAHPSEAMLYRHRGHRYISIRDFGAAVSDLSRAAELKTDDFDIWYHLGLAHYLKGDFALAEPAYRMCLECAKDEGSVIAVANWLYITLMRRGDTADAAKVLDQIREGMDAGENGAYYGLLLFYKGLRTEAELEKVAARSALDLATTGYGLACWHLYRGDTEEALASFERIVAIPYWPAFGFIAAEAELHRAGRIPGR